MSELDPQRAIVWLYHRVATSMVDPFALAVDPTTFEKQVDFLQRRCRLLPLADLLAAQRLGALPSRAVALTFDDGYIDNLRAASPILERVGAPATFFVTTGALDRAEPFWWDILSDLVMSSADLPTTLDLEQTPAGGRSWPTDGPREQLLRDVHAALHTLTAEARDEAMTGLSRQIQRDSRVLVMARPMTAEEISELNARPGHHIESHTVSHLSLPAQTPQARLRELTNSRVTLEHILGRPPSLLAYPFGAWNLEVCREARDAGYDAAFAAAGGSWVAASDRMALPRVQAPNDVQQLIDMTEAVFAGAV